VKRPWLALLPLPLYLALVVWGAMQPRFNGASLVAALVTVWLLVWLVWLAATRGEEK